jgi:hypothetical protein
MSQKHKGTKGQQLTQAMLEARIAGYPTEEYGLPKWLLFCRLMLKQGFTLNLYEARRTFSKYITVSKPGSGRHSFRVRFSNHKPIPEREARGDCDLTITNTSDAIQAVRKHFARED